MEKVIDFAISVQGYNHIKVGKVCQDASSCYSDESMAIIAIADGHGSSDYPRTDKGAKFAVDSAIICTRLLIETLIKDNIDVSQDANNTLEQLAKSILSKWYSFIEEDAKIHPFLEDELNGVSDKYKEKYLKTQTPEKAYGTTLIVTCVTKDFWFGLQIGDGKCVVLESTCEMQEPIPWDDSCQANVTTSICDSDALNEFRYYFSKQIPLAVFLGSDGIDDSYSSVEEYHSLYRTIILLFDENGKKEGKEELENYLPQLSRKGSGDDLSIAGIFLPEVFQENTILLIEAINNHVKAIHELQEKNNNVKMATERLEYILTALNRAKSAYDSALSKEKKARDDIDKAKIELKEAEDNLKKAEESLSEAKNPKSESNQNEISASSSSIVDDIKINDVVDNDILW